MFSYSTEEAGAVQLTTIWDARSGLLTYLFADVPGVGDCWKDVIMMIQLGTLFRRWKSVWYRTLMFSCCSFLLLLISDIRHVSAEEVPDGARPPVVESYERRLGPFTLNDKEFTVLLKVRKYQGAPDGFDETTELLSIVDGKGETHYQKAFSVELGELGFAETVMINAYALKNSDTKIFLMESGELIEDVMKGGLNKGLILYYGFLPTAPLSGVSCQVFALKEDVLTPLFAPLTVYGTVHDLPKGSTENALRLLEGDTVEFGAWTGWFEVIVPIRVLAGLKVVPLHHHLTYGYDAFDVRVERSPSEEDTYVRLFESPVDSSIPRHVVIKKDTKVEFIFAYTRVSIESGADECGISLDTPPWLKVLIDGKEGFIRDEEDLLALGIHPAG